MMFGVFDLFDRYAGCKILKHFALFPSSEIYVNDLARKLGLSVGICSKILRELESLGVLERRKLGHAIYYKLKDNYLTTELKRFVALVRFYDMKLVERLVQEIEHVDSIVLYGSYARGDFNEDSDVDILLIMSEKKRVDLSDIEGQYGLEINVESFSIGQWLKMKEENDAFYTMVMRDHILLYGEELP